VVGHHPDVPTGAEDWPATIDARVNKAFDASGRKLSLPDPR
jgi:hypothetical protein